VVNIGSGTEGDTDVRLIVTDLLL